MEGRVGKQEGAEGGRAEEGDEGQCTCIHLPLVLQFLLTNVVVASPPSLTMSPPSLDCCVVWHWEINEERIIMPK